MSFEVIGEFEQKIAEFYGSPYGVAVDCCTHAIELCLRYNKPETMVVPSRTYISIPFLAKKIGIELEWKEEEWIDFYHIGNTTIIDAAVLWRRDSYLPGTFMCLSFQFRKHLNLGRGGMILTDNKQAALDLKRMSYDGRSPDVPWREQNITTMGYHYYMTPETAEMGLRKLPLAIETQPKQWKTADWPDLRNMGVFK